MNIKKGVTTLRNQNKECVEALKTQEQPKTASDATHLSNCGGAGTLFKQLREEFAKLN